MIREVDLVQYVPEFMKNYQELIACLEAENPEFILVWEGTDRVLYNRFIETADEYGISRYEKMLGIYPSEEDTLESRRARVRSRWFSALPYTWRMLLQRLTVLCGDSGYIISNNFDGEGYTITLIVDLELFGEIEELDDMLNAILPVNIVVDCQNQMPYDIEGPFVMKGGVVYTDCWILTTDFNEIFSADSDSSHAGGVINTDIWQLTNDFNEIFEADCSPKQAGGVVSMDFIEIKSN